MELDGAQLREALASARVMLVFTAELTGPRPPFEVLETLLPWVDVIQVRPKPLGSSAPGSTGSTESPASPASPGPPGPTEARAARDACRAVLDRVRALDRPLPVLVNDRVDVAQLLAPEGLAGVHLGQADCPVHAARELLGPAPLIGLSTHDMEQVAASLDAPVDYLGFGPVFPTRTKGYAKGVSPEAAWVASQASDVPVFPIGGIGLANAQELAQVGRAAVGSALLSVGDPAAAGRRLRELLDPEGASSAQGKSSIASP